VDRNGGRNVEDVIGRVEAVRLVRQVVLARVQVHLKTREAVVRRGTGGAKQVSLGLEKSG
jgi:hypothetical protein